MKKLKYLLIFFITFMFIGRVYADAPESFTLVTADYDYLIDQTVAANEGIANTKYKHAMVGGNDIIALCSGPNTAYPINGKTYTQINWVNDSTKSEEISVGVAAIIKAGIGANATTSTVAKTDSRLYPTQVAIWKYLSSKGISGYEKLDKSISYATNNYSGTSIYNLLNEASKAETSINQQLELASNSPTELIFTEQGNNYVSNRIYFKNIEGYTFESQVDFDGATVSGSSTDGYIVTVPKSSIPNNNTTTIKLTVIATKKISKAYQYYYPDDTTKQKVTLATFDTIDISTSKSISGTIRTSTSHTPSTSYASFKVKKITYDGKGYKMLPNAQLKIINTDTNQIAQTIFGDILEWTSTESENGYQVIGLLAGHYKIVEISAPEGYDISPEISFTLNNNGIVTVDPQENLEFNANLFDKSTNTILVFDNPTEVDVPSTGIKNIVLIILAVVLLFGGAIVVVYGMYKNKQSSEI